MTRMCDQRRAGEAAFRSAMGVMLIVLLAGGCGRPAPANLPRVFSADLSSSPDASLCSVDSTSKYATYEAGLELCREAELPPMNHADFAMLAANRAMIEDAAGNITDAFRAAMGSQRVMTGEVAGEESKAVAAAIADESSKVFKGECYEIAMVNSLLGLYSLRMDDPETAAIGFRRALEADKMSKEQYREDFRLAFWGLGMASLDSDLETAAMAFGKCGYKAADEVAEENLVFLISLGRAPWKRLVGLYGEYDSFTMTPYEPRSAEVFVDGKSMGVATPLINLFKQSQGVPRSGKDVGQGAKSVGKAALAIFAGAVLGSNGQDMVESAWSVKADTRTCYMFPNEIHAFSAKLAPGMHTVRVTFRDAQGAELPRYEQVWNYVEAPAHGRRYLAVRSEFDRCNIQGPIAFTRVSKVKTNAKTESTTIKFRAANLPGLSVGDTLQVCHFYRLVENRWDMQYHWRYAPMAYNGKGEPIGHPGATCRMQDYDIGLIGTATVTEIDGDSGVAAIDSLTTDYIPQPDDMVTSARKRGRLWK